MNIHSLIETYGYGAVFVLVGVESLGVPLPGETTLIAAATYAGVTHRLSIGVIFAVAAAGAILGDTAGYWIGDLGGYRLIYRYGHYVRFDESKIKVAHYLFDRRGGAVVFFGRFVSVLRTYAAFLAGTTRMRYRRFLLFNASGGIVWAAVYAFLAYYAGSFLSKVSTPFEIGFASLAVVFIVVAIFFARRHLSTLVARAEAAYPGPLERPRDRSRKKDVGDPSPDVAGCGEGAGDAGADQQPPPAPREPDEPDGSDGRGAADDSGDRDDPDDGGRSSG
ncbi:MAG TPA: VTT domain-containing protein [Acidimicrobiales bacterium]|nr:VTT domain-containing protein [Acidimicrobiales bacterium]